MVQKSMSGVVFGLLVLIAGLAGWGPGRSRAEHAGAVIEAGFLPPPWSGSPGPVTYRVFLMGDPQFGCVGRRRDPVENARLAMADLATLPHGSLSVLGDLVQGHARYYDEYRKMILIPATTPVFSLPGNGDLQAGLTSYVAATGFPLYHDHYERGIRFIYLGTTAISQNASHVCHLGAAQMEWLEAALAADPVSTTVLLSHAPIRDTTFYSGRTPTLLAFWLEESEQMRELFARFPNIEVYASGHVHYPYGKVDIDGRDGWHLDPQGVLHLSVGDTCEGRGSTALEFSASGILARVRDHGNLSGVAGWRAQYDYFHAVPTTLQ